MNKILNIIIKLSQKIIYTFLRTFEKKIFSYPKKYRSDSDNGRYGLTILKILKEMMFIEKY